MISDYEEERADGNLIRETLQTVCKAYEAAGHSTGAIFNALSSLSTDYFYQLEQEEESEEDE
jgi:hypothetical protein